MPFKDDGFLSPGLAPWTAATRITLSDWFDLVDDLNHEAMKILHSASPSRYSTQELFGALLYGRALSSFEGVAILAERGMIGDARTLVRSCAESAIALGGIALDEGFADALIEDHHKHRLAIANVFLSNAPTQEDLTESQIAGLKQVVAEVNSLYPTAKPRAVNWAEVAQRVGMTTLYDTIYRQMSGDGAHATIEAMNRHVRADADNNVESLTFEPQRGGVAETLSSSISALLFAMDALARVFKRADIEQGVKTYVERWKQLPMP